MEPSYREKQIKNLQKEDMLVALSGIIVSKEINSFVLDDGTGSIGVFFDELQQGEEGYIRVFGRLSSSEEGMEIQADFVQDLGNIDKKLHKKVIQLLE